MNSSQSYRRIGLLLGLPAFLLLCTYLLILNYDQLYIATHSPRQNLAHLNATDLCRMYPIAQLGNPIDTKGHAIEPVMTVYLSAPKGRRPTNGDLLDIRYPQNLIGQVRFNLAKSNGYGGSGPLEWVGEKRGVRLGMAVWDFTYSGSLQYERGDVRLWGDCVKENELEG